MAVKRTLNIPAPGAPASEASEQQNFDGLSKAEAIRLCVRRHAELSASQLTFLNVVGARDKPLTKEQALRLTAIMERFRQDDLISHLQPGAAA
jgi:hypothetical protein